jgi:hypothetical protein
VIILNAEELLKDVEKKYGITSTEVLTIYSRNFYSTPDEIKFYMEKIPELTAEDIFSTIDRLKNPNPSSRFVWEINQVTMFDKDGNIKSEPKDWIAFGKNWYDKRDLVKKDE